MNILDRDDDSDGSCESLPLGLKRGATPFPAPFIDPDEPEIKSTVQRYVERFKSILDGTAKAKDPIYGTMDIQVGNDKESQANMADDLIKEFLREIGFKELADLMDHVVRRW